MFISAVVVGMYYNELIIYSWIFRFSFSNKLISTYRERYYLFELHLIYLNVKTIFKLDNKSKL